MRPINFCFLIAVFPIFISAGSTITARRSKIVATEGKTVLFEWDYSLRPGDEKIREDIVFGPWEHGDVAQYLITITKEGRVVYHPLLAKANSSYVGRPAWVGNITKSYLAYSWPNVTISDSNRYGVRIWAGGYSQTINSMITLIVKRIETSVKPEPRGHTPTTRSNKPGPASKKGTVGSAKSKWKEQLQLLPYLSVLVVPAILCIFVATSYHPRELE